MPSRSFYRPANLDHLKAILSHYEVELTTGWDIPEIPAPEFLAEYIGVDISLLQWMLRSKRKNYRTFHLEKSPVFVE